MKQLDGLAEVTRRVITVHTTGTSCLLLFLPVKLHYFAFTDQYVIVPRISGPPLPVRTISYLGYLPP